MSVVDDYGNVTILHQETSASDVLVDRTENTQGDSGNSAIPSDVDSLQKLTNKLGSMAFKSEILSSDLSSVEEGILVVGLEAEDSDIVLPESEINDDVISVSSTWSSEKIHDITSKIDTNFYIPLMENAEGGYTTDITVQEIEEAYRADKLIWVVASEIFLPLRLRTNSSTWVFSGYADGQAYDITITTNAVTLTYKEVATTNDRLPNPSPLKLTGAVQAVYDGTNEVEVPVAPITVGISENSIQQAGSSAGVKGYYWASITGGTIDTTNNVWKNAVITLSTTQGVDSGLTTIPWKTYAEDSAYVISIHNDFKHDYCAKITNVSGNKITVDVLPFTAEIRTDDDLDFTDFAVFVPEKPSEGVIDFGLNTTSIGINNIAIGYGAVAFGRDNKAYSQYSFVAGRDNVSYYASMATGRGNKALKDNTFAGGYKSEATSNMAFAFGREAHANGWISTAFGRGTNANGQLSFVAGDGNTANGECAFVGGKSNTAGYCGLAMGQENNATGADSFAGGYKCDATQTASVAYGHTVKTNSRASVGFGESNTINGSHSIVTGQGNTVAADKSAVFGYEHTNITGSYNLVSGHKNIVNGSNNIIAGEVNSITNSFCSAFGTSNEVTGWAANAMGNDNYAYGTDVLVGGYNSKADVNALASIAYGHSNYTNFRTTAVFGEGNKASSNHQTIVGKFNKENTNAVFQVGFGTSNTARKNIFEVLNDGIVVNGVTLTSTKLQKIINFIDSIE